MAEIERIIELLQVCYNGAPWHGPSLMANLEGITAEQAAQKPIANGHCVWELVQHMTGWINEVIKTLDGEQYTVLTPEEDWPAIGSGDAAWQSTLAILDSTQEALCGAVGDVAEETLWTLPEGQEFNYYWMLHGVVLHYAYHTGQIGLIRKSLA